MSNTTKSAIGALMTAAAGDKTWDKRDVDIEHSGTKITLPEGPPGDWPRRSTAPGHLFCHHRKKVAGGGLTYPRCVVT